MQKNQTFSSFSFRDIVDLKILQSDWSRVFWSISQESNFSQIWDLCKNRANNLTFNNNLISKFSNKIKKPSYWPIFPNFGAISF